MSKSPRRIGLQTSHQKPDPSVPEDLPEDPAKGPLADTAGAAVAILIGRALEACSVTAADAAADGVVTLVLVPSAAWVDVARDGCMRRVLAWLDGR